MQCLRERKQLRKVLVLVLVCATSALAQSGRSGMRGYVAFADLSYNEVAERRVKALVELRRTAADKNPVTVRTDEHGSFAFTRFHPVSISSGSQLRVIGPTKPKSTFRQISSVTWA
jgi:hypothetical protein